MPDTSLLVAVIAVVGALAAGATARTHPLVALAILFLLASWSRATLETPIGTMRLEMPAIAVVTFVLLMSGQLRVLRGLPAMTLVMVLGFATYLGILALSSATVAPGTAQSLRMVAWLGISMLGGIDAFVLARSNPADTMEPLSAAGGVMGVAGVFVAAAFLVQGPATSIGIQDPMSAVPRVYALGWETNLYASFLAMCSFFAYEVARRRSMPIGWPLLAVVLIAFPLGVTRGAYLGLAAGVVVYALIRLRLGRRPSDLPWTTAAAIGLLAVGILASNVLLPNLIERAQGGVAIAEPSASPSGRPVANGSGGSPAGGSTQGAGGTESPVVPASAVPPTASPLPVPSLEPESDTVAFRLERVPIALAEIPSSPLIGFGAESFGQRHPERYAGSGQDHIAILAVVAPYESGLVGTAGLVVGFTCLLLSLFRAATAFASRGDSRSVGAAAAFAASMTSILVAYEVTNALHLAINWIVIGAATALVVSTRDALVPHRARASDTALSAASPRPSE